MSTLYILTYFKVFVSKDDVLDKGSADIKNFIKGIKNIIDENDYGVF